MKLHLLFVACMTLFIISCGENNSGNKKDDKKVGTLMVSNGQCQNVGMATLNYKGRYYQIDNSNQQLINDVYQLAQQAMMNGGINNTTGGNGGYPYTTGFNGGGNPYNGYNGGNPYYTNVQATGSDQCTTHYRMEFKSRSSNVNNNGYGGGYGGYGGVQQETLSITSYRFR